jgi:hypothetical protein
MLAAIRRAGALKQLFVSETQDILVYHLPHGME